MRARADGADTHSGTPMRESAWVNRVGVVVTSEQVTALHPRDPRSSLRASKPEVHELTLKQNAVKSLGLG